MFSKELENLIQATLEDGILEDYEKAALVKRATAEGVDLAELEIYINSILQKRKKEHEQAENAKQEQIDKQKKEAFGRVCPNCGSQVPPMTLKCECGFEFTNTSQRSAVQILSEKIESISKSRRNTLTEAFTAKAKVNEMVDLITVFPVPNTKEDIIEFLALSISKSKVKGGIWGTVGGRMKVVSIATALTIILGIICGALVGDENSFVIGTTGFTFGMNIFFWGAIFSCFGYQEIIRDNKLAVAWREKFDQVMIKGRSMRGDAEFTNQLNYYESLLNK